ncbi:MAG: alpha-mannosidase, partial [Muribaculaceae bacterium]|nr:alpha-mannosidase [Muribaculaceae bacterium]
MKQKLHHAMALSALLATASATAAAPKPTDGDRPVAYMVSDAHLDTQWNWDIQTTIGEYVWNTINQNLFLLKKYPDYVFNFEGGVKYAWMKEYYPIQYEELKKYVKNGRWHISGASWDANDAIVHSPESFIRNILLGQTFYRDEFGVESTDIFLPDCFGFGWTLPTIASHCGLIGFSSQKLGWRHRPFHGDSKYPFSVGLWQGVDGSKIMMTHGFNYGQRYDQQDLTHNEELRGRIAESGLGAGYHYYGTGDIGGSPTMNSVDAVTSSINGNGPLRIVSATSDQIYKDYLPFESHPELPVYDGELLMDVHGTGCYTSQAAMKLYNRQNELLGDAAERAAVAARMLGVAPYPSENITKAWQRFIFHQFHDDLTGTSIPRAYEFSWNDELLSLSQFADMTTAAAGAVASQLDTRAKGVAIVLYNPLGHEVTAPVEISVDAKARPASATVVNHLGKKVSSQVTGYADGKATILAEATVPANGYAVYDVRLSGKGENRATGTKAGSIENSLYRITLDGNGDISSLVDKRNGKELVAQGKAIRLALFTQNRSHEWPAWEIIKETVDATPVSVSGNVKISQVENGPLRSTLKVEKTHGDSHFTQYISLYEGAAAHRIDFRNEIDWNLTNALLKAEFPLSASDAEATYDLGIGTVRRGNNTPTAYEVYAQRWADLTDKSGSHGVTVMNDSKYGWDKPDDSTLRLTLIHTPETARGYAYQNKQDFGHHSFTYSLVPHNGALDCTAASTEADKLNQKIKAFAVASHNGSLGKSYSPLTTDNRNVAIKAMKMAESTDEYVVRVYETSGKEEQTAALTFACPILTAFEADGTEKAIGAASFSGNSLNVKVKPNGIKTFKVRLATPDVADNGQTQLCLLYQSDAADE